MAEFLLSVGKTLKSEGGFDNNETTGECVNFGITHWFLRSIGVLHGVPRAATADEVAFVRAMTREYAISLYLRHFWTPHRLGEVVDQPLADKIFDLTVNQGPGGIVRGKLVDGGITLLQKAVNLCQSPAQKALTIDGRVGPITLAQINGCPARLLLATYRKLAELQYREIARNPLLAGNLPAWLNRLAG